jgi:hypothetical protein
MNKITITQGGWSWVPPPKGGEHLGTTCREPVPGTTQGTREPACFIGRKWFPDVHVLGGSLGGSLGVIFQGTTPGNHLDPLFLAAAVVPERVELTRPKEPVLHLPNTITIHPNGTPSPAHGRHPAKASDRTPASTPRNTAIPRRDFRLISSAAQSTMNRFIVFTRAIPCFVHSPRSGCAPDAARPVLAEGRA